MRVQFEIPGKPHLTNEVWRPIPGYEGKYEVSSFGRVKSLARRVQRKDGFWQSYAEKILRQSVGTHGYPRVALCNGGPRGKTRTVHSLVAEAFLGPRPKGHEVRHLNGDCEDPSAENLEYATSQANQHDRRAHGTHNFGARNPCAKLKADDVAAIRDKAASGISARELGRRYRVSDSAIRDILHHRTWAMKCA